MMAAIMLKVEGKTTQVNEPKRPKSEDTTRKNPDATIKTNLDTGGVTGTQYHRGARQGSRQGRGLEHPRKSTRWKEEMNPHLMVTSLDHKYQERGRVLGEQ